MNKGLFISIEGTDGCGKTSVIKEIKRHFSDNKNVVYTREPGGYNNKISEKIRELVLNNEMDFMTEALLFAASRSENVSKFILPNLENNKIVISDRYFDSSLVYQGIARNIGIENIYDMNVLATKNLIPVKTFVLSVEPKISKARIESSRIKLPPSRRVSNDEMNRFDVEQPELQKKVFDGYLHLSKMYPERIILIDASRDFKIVCMDLIKKIEELIKKHGL